MKGIIITFGSQKGVLTYSLTKYINTELDDKIHHYYREIYSL